MSARCRQNYHQNSEAAINKQINLELYASYVYMSLVKMSVFHIPVIHRFHYLFFFFRHIILIEMMLH